MGGGASKVDGWLNNGNISIQACRTGTDGRRPVILQGGGKSGLHRTGCWITSSLGDEKESATESKPPDTQHFLIGLKPG